MAGDADAGNPPVTASPPLQSRHRALCRPDDARHRGRGPSFAISQRPRRAATNAEIEQVTAELARGRAGGLLVLTDIFTHRAPRHHSRHRAHTASHRLFRALVHGGRRADSYGIDYADLVPALGRLCRPHPEGLQPQDLPVQEPTKFELAINLRSAKARDITCRRRCLPPRTK